MLYTIIMLLLALFLFGLYFMNRPEFGKHPSGDRLQKILRSPHYKDGQFQNLSPTPQLEKGYNIFGVLINFLFRKPEHIKPKNDIPVIKTDLKNLSRDSNLLIWFGHSSYLFILNGKTFLVDPVLSDNASPVPGSNKAYKGTSLYTADDLPAIDYLIITHDHFDHLDYPTIRELKGKVQQVICGLGVGEHLEYWGYPAAGITELDWYESTEFTDGVRITATPARHFSGRTFKRNTTLFCSYVLQSGDTRIFVGGDSGYDTHFKAIGTQYGPFDLAILENGQYNEAWRYIHTLPSEMPAVIKDINARNILPVHSGKFALALHSWKEPLTEIIKLQNTETRILTPRIGEVLKLDDSTQTFSRWWEEAE